jgi:hypothetical protein
MNAQPQMKETAFTPSWLEPDPRLLRTELPPLRSGVIAQLTLEA